MRNLERFGLSRTGITELPSTMRQLATLKHLNLEGTKLERLPREVYNLTKLETFRTSVSFEFNHPILPAMI